MSSFFAWGQARCSQGTISRYREPCEGKRVPVRLEQGRKMPEAVQFVVQGQGQKDFVQAPSRPGDRYRSPRRPRRGQPSRKPARCTRRAWHTLRESARACLRNSSSIPISQLPQVSGVGRVKHRGLGLMLALRRVVVSVSGLLVLGFLEVPEHTASSWQ